MSQNVVVRNVKLGGNKTRKMRSQDISSHVCHKTRILIRKAVRRKKKDASDEKSRNLQPYL